MPAYKYKTPEAHQAHLAYRRDYYQRNRDKIRARDNASAQRKRQENPERYKEYQNRFREKKKALKAKQAAVAAQTVSFESNPDHDEILAAIHEEQEALP